MRLTVPSKPKRPCPTPGCRALIRGDECKACGWRKPRWNWKPDRERGARQERGYDQAWQNLRMYKLAHDPLCERCEREGRTEAAVEVHHKRPFKGRRDPLRLMLGNLESICLACHRAETAGRKVEK